MCQTQKRSWGSVVVQGDATSPNLALLFSLHHFSLQVSTSVFYNLFTAYLLEVLHSVTYLYVFRDHCCDHDKKIVQTIPIKNKYMQGCSSLAWMVVFSVVMDEHLINCSALDSTWLHFLNSRNYQHYSLHFPHYKEGRKAFRQLREKAWGLDTSFNLSLGLVMWSL